MKKPDKKPLAQTGLNATRSGIPELFLYQSETNSNKAWTVEASMHEHSQPRIFGLLNNKAQNKDQGNQGNQQLPAKCYVE